MLQYFPSKYIDNYFPKRYFHIKDGEIVVPIPSLQQEISLGGYSPLIQIDRDELFKDLNLKIPDSKLIPLISKLLVKIENNAEEDEAIALSLIYRLVHKEQREEEELIYYVQLVVELIEIIEREEGIEKENENLIHIMEELNKLNLI
jgi:hypothetical protein